MDPNAKIIIRNFEQPDEDYAPMGRLRFVLRDGKRILQQWWGYCGMYPEWGSNAHSGYWSDVPMEDE